MYLLCPRALKLYAKLELCYHIFSMEPISLSKVIQYAWQHSEFYRRFWKQKGFDPNRDFENDNDLEKIPILTKEDLLSVPMKHRSILRSKDCHYFIDVSSGTMMNPLLVLKQRYAMPPYFRFIENLDKGSRSSYLILRPPTYATAFLGAGLQGQYFPLGSIVSMGDANNPVFSAYLAKETETDCLMSRPSDAVRFANALKEQGYSPSNIMSLYITGEPLTLATISILKRLYPDALILYVYAMTEGPASMGLKSSLCSTLETISPGAYHLNTSDFIFETINGLSVVTALHKMPTPLIRYNTGDQIIIKDDIECSCGFPKDIIGIIGPRDNEKSYKIGGHTFQAEKVKQALRKMSGLVTEDFELQIEQVSDGANILNLLRFTINPIGDPAPILTNIILDTLKQELRVTQSQFLGNAIRQDLIGQIEIKYDKKIRGEKIIPPSEIVKPFLQYRENKTM